MAGLGSGPALAASLRSTPIDILIYNAGVNPDADASPEKGKADSFVMNVNGIAPFMIVTPLLENVAASSLKTLAFVSSQLGSREVFGNGKIPEPIYHASKCVLNDGFREQEPMWRPVVPPIDRG